MSRFVIIEDQQMVSEMLAGFIESRMDDYQCAGHALSADDGIKLCRKTHPDLALVDIHINDTDGISVAQAIAKELPDIHVILISADCSPYNCYRIAQSKIKGFVDKSRPLTELDHAIKQVMAGKSWFPPSFEKQWKEYGKSPDAFFKILSTREQQVLLRIAAGDNDNEVAEQLDIRPRTAETHRHNIIKKLGLSDSAALRKYVIKHGMWCPKTDSD
jgi:DNA-binding NarL/FixJ family response regulator